MCERESVCVHLFVFLFLFVFFVWRNVAIQGVENIISGMDKHKCNMWRVSSIIIRKTHHITKHFYESFIDDKSGIVGLKVTNAFSHGHNDF